MASLTDILQKLDSGDESQNGTTSASSLKAPDSHAGSDVNQIGEGGQTIGEPGNTDGASHQESVASVDPNQAHNTPAPGDHVDGGHQEEAPCLDPNQAGTHKSTVETEDTVKSLSDVVSVLKDLSNQFSTALSLVEKSTKGKKDNKDMDEDDDMDESMDKGKGKSKDKDKGKDKDKNSDTNKSVTSEASTETPETSAEEPALSSEDITEVSEDEKDGTTVAEGKDSTNKSANVEPETAKAVSSDTTDKSLDTNEEGSSNEGTSDTPDTAKKSYVLDNGLFTANVPAEVLASDMKKSIKDISNDYTEGPNSPRVHAIIHLYHKLTDSSNTNKSVSASLVESYNSIK